MVLGNVLKFFSSTPDPGTDEIVMCPHAEFAALPCETPHNDTCQTIITSIVQPEGCTRCTRTNSKKYRSKKKSKLDRLIDQEFDELYKNLKQFNEDNDCLLMKKRKKHKLNKQDEKILPNGCRDYGAFVANKECKNMFDVPKTNQVNCYQREKEKKSNFGQCWSAFEKIRNRFAKDVGKINQELDVDAITDQHFCKKSRFEKVKDNFMKDYDDMIKGYYDRNDQCSLKQNKSKNKGKCRKKDQRVYTTSESTKSSEMGRNKKSVKPTRVLKKNVPLCCPLKEEENGDQQCKYQENSSEGNGIDEARNRYGDNEQEEYPKIEQILGQNKKFVLKECEFIFKSPVNKDYLIKIRELEEANEGYNQSEEGAKNKLVNFICGKNDKTQQPTTSKGKRKSCEEKFKRKEKHDSKGKDNAGVNDGKKKPISMENRNQGVKEKETMKDKIKSLLCDGRLQCGNDNKCKSCRTKLNELSTLPFEDKAQSHSRNENKCKTCSRNNRRPETGKDRKDMDMIEICSCKNNNETNEENRESEETCTQTEDEFRFLNELCSESFTDHSDTLENKIEKKKFFEAFLQFLEENKEEIRKQYQQYRTNCSIGGESGDSNYLCRHENENHLC
ncbi:hypothetical protein WDU94_008385 [Cyamophila willieti]